MARATQRSATQRMPAKARATTTRGTRGASSAAQVVEDPIIQRGIRVCRQAMNAVLNAFPSNDRPEIEAAFGQQFFGGLRHATSSGQPRKQARALAAPRGTRSATSTGRTTKAPTRSRTTNAAPSSGRGPQAGTRSARSSGAAAGPKRTTTRAKRNQGFAEHQGQGQQAQGNMENQQQP